MRASETPSESTLGSPREGKWSAAIATAQTCGTIAMKCRIVEKCGMSRETCASVAATSRTEKANQTAHGMTHLRATPDSRITDLQVLSSTKGSIAEPFALSRGNVRTVMTRRALGRRETEER